MIIPGFEDAMMLALESYDKNNKLEMKMETREKMIISSILYLQ